MQQDVLAMLAKEPSHGYELRARLRAALGPLGEDHERGADLRHPEPAGEGGPRHRDEPAWPDRPDRKVYALTPAGQQRVADWLAEVSWPRPDLAEFHLKLVAAAAAGLADPIGIVDAQRRELLRRLRDAQRAAMAEPEGSDAGAAARRDRAPAAGRPALAGSLRTDLDQPEGEAMTDTGEAQLMLRARGLCKEYGSDEGLVRAVDEVDLDVAGETVAVMGPSGCGKSTLLHLLGGLDRPARGEIWLAGQRVDQMSERAWPGCAQRRRLCLPGLPPDGRADRAGERRAARAAGRALAAGGPAAGR